MPGLAIAVPSATPSLFWDRFGPSGHRESSNYARTLARHYDVCRTPARRPRMHRATRHTVRPIRPLAATGPNRAATMSSSDFSGLSCRSPVKPLLSNNYRHRLLPWACFILKTCWRQAPLQYCRVRLIFGPGFSSNQRPHALHCRYSLSSLTASAN